MTYTGTMTDQQQVRYLPDSIAANLRYRLRGVSPDTAFRVTRIVEIAYAEGYGDGYRRGEADGYEEHKRAMKPAPPTDAELDALRDKLTSSRSADTTEEP